MAQTLEASELKQLTNLNLNQLELALTECLMGQVGGLFSVHIARFSQFNESGAALEIDLRIFDHDSSERPYPLKQMAPARSFPR